MRHVLNSTWDSHAVKQLDTDLAGCVGDISMTLNVAQMRMQQRTFDEVEKLTTAIETHRENDGGTLSESALQQVSECHAVIGPGSRTPPQRLLSCRSLATPRPTHPIRNQIVEAAGCSREEADEELRSVAADIKAIIDGQQLLMMGEGELMSGQEKILHAEAEHSAKVDATKAVRTRYAPRPKRRRRRTSAVGPASEVKVNEPPITPHRRRSRRGRMRSRECLK